MAGLLEEIKSSLLGLLDSGGEGLIPGSGSPPSLSPTPPARVGPPTEDIYPYDLGISKRDFLKLIAEKEMRGYANPWRSTAYKPRGDQSTAFGPGGLTALMLKDLKNLPPEIEAFKNRIVAIQSKSLEEKKKPGTHGSEYGYSDKLGASDYDPLKGTYGFGSEGPTEEEQEWYWKLSEAVLDRKVEIINQKRKNAAKKQSEDTPHLSSWNKPMKWETKDMRDVSTLLQNWYGNPRRKLNEAYAQDIIKKSMNQLQPEMDRFTRNIKVPPR